MFDNCIWDDPLERRNFLERSFAAWEWLVFASFAAWEWLVFADWGL